MVCHAEDVLQHRIVVTAQLCNVGVHGRPGFYTLFRPALTAETAGLETGYARRACQERNSELQFGALSSRTSAP